MSKKFFSKLLDRNHDGHIDDWAVPFLLDLTPWTLRSQTYQNATLDDSAINPATGNIWRGSGNDPNGWQIENNSREHLQVATEVHYRQGDGILPTTYAQDTFKFVAPDGPQIVDPAHNVPVAHAGRAATSFGWSISTNTDGNGETLQSYLQDHDIFVRLQFTDTSGREVLDYTLHAEYDPIANPNGSHIVWEDAQGNRPIMDDAGTAFVTQNDQNLAFYAAIMDMDPNTAGVQPYAFQPGLFEFDVTVVDLVGIPHVDASIHNDVLLV